jgi:outer membrane protein
MKRIILIALFAVVTAGASAQTVKIGYVNSLEILSLMPETKVADAELQKMARELEAQYREYIMEYQKLANQIQSNTELTDVAREAKMQDLGNLEQRITEYESTSQEKISAKRNELYEPILAKATETVQTVAEENGYTHILDSSTGAIIHAPEGDNILELVKAKLGLE